MNDRVTMREVARRAGVHVTTVSLALRNNIKLPLATRERLRPRGGDGI
jgi:DNA-binding LacI/PurR family transcriptional regulator